MKLTTGLKAVVGLLLLMASIAVADERYVLQYDSPAVDQFTSKNPTPQKGKGKKKGPNFMQTALPLGNGRLGAMFSGGIETEHLAINDITLWMNAKRGLDKVAQSGTRIGASKNLETVREAYREGKYGTKSGSMESLGTEYLSSKVKIGNYAPFSDVLISTGHDPASIKDYRRSLDSQTGLGTVSYSIGDAKFTREFFCSHPHDVVAAHYTASGDSPDSKLNLTVATSTKHKISQVKADGNRITLTGEAAMTQDNGKFAQIIEVNAGDGVVEPQSDGSIKVTGASDVTIVLAGYCDYLPVYPTFKGRDFNGDCEKAISAATKVDYAALKTAHVEDFSSRMKRCQLELDFEPSGLTTDKLVKRGGLELENLYFNYSRYLQLSCSRDAPVPSNLQGLWNDSLRPIWNSDYHTDINVQMNYWMVDAANLSESFRPFASWTKVLAESGKHTARETFRRRQRLEHGTQRQRVWLHRSE